MNAVLVLNPNSGTLSLPENRELLLTALHEAGFEAPVITVANGLNLEAALRPHLENGCPTVIAAGGDGTINAVASLLVGTSVRLGVIPGGTLNHFSSDLGIPTDLTAAVQILKTGITQSVDVGAVNGRIFLNNSGLGLYPEMVMKREEIRKHGFQKATALLIASALTLLRFPLLRVRLAVNGQALQRFTPFVFVGNNAYQVDGLQFGVRSRLDQGQLCVWVARRTRRFGLLRAVIKMAFQGLSGVRELDVLTTTAATIAPRRRFVPVSLDGEVVKLRTPLQYEIRPGALRVIIPAPSEPAPSETA
jgi:diacylglycerol kinase family enzyme